MMCWQQAVRAGGTDTAWGAQFLLRGAALPEPFTVLLLWGTAF